MMQHGADLHPTIRCSNALYWTAALVLPSLVAIGCSPKQPVAEGLVTLDGMPIAAGAIRFLPADGKGPTAGAGIIAGRYRVETTEGPKRVWISFAQKDGTKMLDPEAMGSGQMIDRYVESVPKGYNENTELEFTVKPGRNVADFAIEGSLLKETPVSPK
jgi:hypothetical protein